MKKIVTDVLSKTYIIGDIKHAEIGATEIAKQSIAHGILPSSTMKKIAMPKK